MSDLDVIKAIEKQIEEPLSPCELDTVMSANSRCCYVLDSAQQVIGLNLQNCKQTDLLLLKNLKNLSQLNLSLNQITQLKSLKDLVKLTQLNLHKNNITEITPLKELAGLTHLNLQDNQVAELRPLKELKNIHVLNLQANQISELKYLAGLNGLTGLNLSSNQIKDLSPLKELKQLISLNLSSNQIAELEALQKFSELVELDLRFNQITHIAPLKSLKKIIQLYLSTNSISEIEPLCGLNDLAYLYLSSNQISDITALEELKHLIELDLRSNKIASIDALENLNKLSFLYLENNQISEISPLKNLLELTQLNLRNNQIENIDGLKNLKKLTQLYLSNNKIQTLPKWILDFNLKIKWTNGGDGISVMANPLKHPAPEIIRQGNSAIKACFEASTQQQQYPVNEVKICFVGDCGTGKSSVQKLLCGGQFDKNEPSTAGIKIAQWQFDSFIAHCWDFGGDEKIQATHSLFFSEQCIYILVLDNRPQRNEERWLKKIEYLAGNVPILIVLNKCDETEGYDVNRPNLIRSYNSLQENSFFSVSCAQLLGLEALKTGILSAFKQLPLSKKLWSKSWIQVKNSLAEQLKQQHYLSSQGYTEICVQHGVKELDQQEQLVHFLHDLGIFVHFKKFNFFESYILDSDWLTQSLYKIICSPQLTENKGILPLKELGRLFKADSEKDYDYSMENFRDLINLMRNLELCFLMDKTSILVPQLLEVEEPEIEFSYDNLLRFRLHYEYLDQTIMSRFIVILREDIVGHHCWRTGVLLHNKLLDADALVKVDYHEHLIIIQVGGKKSREYFAMIRKALRNIEATL